MPASAHATLPGDACPAVFRAAQLAMEHSDERGRLRFASGPFAYLRDQSGIACLVAAYVTGRPDNPLYRNDRLADLIARAGRFLVSHHLAPATNPPGHMWYDGREIHEWAFELWLAAYRILCEGGAAELTAGWEDGLRAGAAAFFRWCREIEHVRAALSPNLNVSPNHLAFFIQNTLEAGIVLGIPEYRDAGLERARWLTEEQDPDGYWPETDGPTTSYNFITTGAVGYYYRLTGEQLFKDALRRTLDFHLRFTYPDASFLETIDQRVRYRAEPSEHWVWTLHAFSLFPAGRALNQFAFRRLRGFEALGTNGHRMGRLAKNLLLYGRGLVPPVPESLSRGSFRLTQPGGIVKDGTWAVGLCGIASRPRPHRHTLDRQNLLSVWHKEPGLVVGGGNSRNQPHAATFHKRVPIDPQATADGVTEIDAYTPVTAELELSRRSGRLALGYWGFDAELAARIVNSRRLRIAASAWGRKALMPVEFTLNLRLAPGVPLTTAGGLKLAIDGSPIEVAGDKLGGWIAQGRWRISAPTGARLVYPFRPYYPTIKPKDLSLDMLYGLLTVPISNETIELEVIIT